MTPIEVIKSMNFCGLCTTGNCAECDRKIAKDEAINALEEIQQYREIGTLDECRAAVEKQRADKPQKVLLSYGTGYECKQCGNELSVNAFNGEYCHWCGQKLDWSDEE